MFAGLWPGVPVGEVPITSVTNGVHARTWVSGEMRNLLDRYVLPEWDQAGPERWARIQEVGDDELWRVREQSRAGLVAFARRRLRDSAMARGLSAADLAWCDQALDPRILTIGFARRFAAYKRANLLLSQPERLAALLLSPDRPVQILFAGKAHPADHGGKEMIRQIVQFCRRPELRHRIVFLEDYDIATARMLLQGCDLWLNNPRRPLEACGTSGQKAALNGVLNCSISDGWWDEWYDGHNGWAIPSAESYDDLGRRDNVEASSLFELLEQEVIPLFYDRQPGFPPRRWLERVRASLQSLGPKVPAARMVRDYVEQLYEPAARRADAMKASGFDRARTLAAWKARVRAAWPAVRVRDVQGDDSPVDLGEPRQVWAEVELGSLSPADVEVQLVHGPVGLNDELTESVLVTMATSGGGSQPGLYRYECSFPAEPAGRHGFTVRVVPAHPDLTTFADAGCVAWA